MACRIHSVLMGQIKNKWDMGEWQFYFLEPHYVSLMLVRWDQRPNLKNLSRDLNLSCGGNWKIFFTYVLLVNTNCYSSLHSFWTNYIFFNAHSSERTTFQFEYEFMHFLELILSVYHVDCRPQVIYLETSNVKVNLQAKSVLNEN